MADLIPPVLEPEILQELREMAGIENPEVFVEIVMTYLDDAPTLLQAIGTAIEQQQLADLKIAAHTLKSISATLGATSLSEICKEVEMLGGSGEIEQARDYLPQLAQEFERVRIALETECQQS